MISEQKEMTLNAINEHLIQKVKEKDELCLQICEKYEKILKEMRKRMKIANS